MALTFSQFLESIGTSGARSYQLMETFILGLLEAELNAQGRTLQVPAVVKRADHLPVEVDALAPDGIGDLPGPTIVELQLRLGLPGSGQHSRLLNILATHAGAVGPQSVLLIFIDRIPSVIRQQLRHRFRSENPNITFALWDFSNLSELVSRHEALAQDLLSRLSTVRLEKALAKPEQDWRVRRSKHLELLRQSYLANDAVLFLGAGVSVDAGLPAWSELLDALFVTLITRNLKKGSSISDDEVSAIIKRFREMSDPSPLMTARYLRRGLAEGTVGDLESFLVELTDVLYRLASPGRAQASDLLAQLSRMSIPRRSGPRVRAVVTYNFDDLMERALESIPVAHRSIFREGDLAGRDELPVFHVHGFLPRDRSQYTGLDKGTIVFSEEGYHELFQDPYHWSNLVQLSLLREHTCVMVGLSLTDPNLRRLLEIAARRNTGQHHYAFLRRLAPTAFVADNRSGAIEASESSVREFLDSHHRLTEELLKELGLSVVWYEEHSDVPQLLVEIQSIERAG